MRQARVTGRTLSTQELNRATLARQLLLRREPITAVEVMERLVGMQAQEPHDPYLALWSRLENFAPAELSDLLEQRAAVRAVGLMRGTIHLVSAPDALRLRPLIRPVLESQWRHSSFAKSLDGVDLSEIVDAGRTLLAQRPLSATELGRLLAERWPDRDPGSLGYAVRFALPLVQVPPRGLWGRTGKAVVQTVESWLGRPLEPDPSLDELVVRYLAAFGPATVGDMRVWSWLTGLRQVVERLRPKLRTFRDENGRELFDVPDGPIPDPDTPAPVRFLPMYDNLFLSHEDRSRVMDRRFGEGWLRGPVLVDGFLAGTWAVERRRDVATLRVGTFRSLDAAERTDVETEADAAVAFLAADAADRRVEITRLE